MGVLCRTLLFGTTLAADGFYSIPRPVPAHPPACLQVERVLVGQQTLELLGLAMVAGNWATQQRLPLPLACGLTAGGDVAVWVLQPPPARQQQMSLQGTNGVSQAAHADQQQQQQPTTAVVLPATPALAAGDSSEEEERGVQQQSASGAPLLPYVRGVHPAVMQKLAAGELKCARMLGNSGGCKLLVGRMLSVANCWCTPTCAA